MKKQILVRDKTKNIPLGSVIADDLYSDSGALLLKKGTIVDKQVYSAFRDYRGMVSFYRTIYVEDRQFVLTEEIKKQTLEGVQHIFGDEIKAQEQIDTAHEIADRMVRILNESNNIAVYLQNLQVTDEYTFRHSIDVGTTAMLIGKQIGLGDDQLRDLVSGGILHDLGKMDIPKSILEKPARLSNEEFEVIKTHPVHGFERIKDTNVSDDVKEAVLQHHENVDGSGYPQGLTSDQINPYAKVMTISDVFDALLSDRPYKIGKQPNETIEMMYAMTHKFDKAFLNNFMHVVIAYPSGSIVNLSNEFTCRVVRQNMGYPLRPVVEDLDYGMQFDLLRDPDLANVVIL